MRKLREIFFSGWMAEREVGKLSEAFDGERKGGSEGDDWLKIIEGIVISIVIVIGIAM